MGLVRTDRWGRDPARAERRRVRRCCAGDKLLDGWVFGAVDPYDYWLYPVDIGKESLKGAWPRPHGHVVRVDGGYSSVRFGAVSGWFDPRRGFAVKTEYSLKTPLRTGQLVEDVAMVGVGEPPFDVSRRRRYWRSGGALNRLFLWNFLRAGLVPRWLVSVDEGLGAWMTVVGERRVEVRDRSGNLLSADEYASERDACEAVLWGLADPPDWVWDPPSDHHIQLAYERELTGSYRPDDSWFDPDDR